MRKKKKASDILVIVGTGTIMILMVILIGLVILLVANLTYDYATGVDKKIELEAEETCLDKGYKYVDYKFMDEYLIAECEKFNKETIEYEKKKFIVREKVCDWRRCI